MFHKRLVAIFLWVAASALAQDSRQEIVLEEKQEKAKELSKYEVSKTEARVRRLERVKFPRNILEQGYRGVRPLVGGMPSGSGFVLGVGYLHDPDFGLFRFEGNARYSTRSFRELDAGLEFPSKRLGRKLYARLNTAYQDYTSLRFFRAWERLEPGRPDILRTAERDLRGRCDGGDYGLVRAHRRRRPLARRDRWRGPNAVSRNGVRCSFRSRVLGHQP